MIKHLFQPFQAACVVLCIAVFCVYIPSLPYGFLLDWDDAMIASNTALGSFSPAFFKFSFTALYPYWQPLNWISLGIDKVLWHNWPSAFRAVNILLHCANCLMVVQLTTMLLPLLRKQFSQHSIQIAALFSGVLFGLHPLRVESVVWITERKDVLAATFALLSTLTYLTSYYGSTRRSRWYSLLFYILSLLTKPSIIFLPLIFVLMDWLINRQERWADLMASLSAKRYYHVITGGYLTLLLVKASVFEGVAAKGAESSHGYSTIDMVIAFARSVFFYFEKLVLPLNLSPLYATVSRQELYTPLYLILTALFFALTVSATIYARKFRGAATAWYATLLLLIPTVGSLVGGGFSFIAADRISYCMSIVPGLLIAFALAAVLQHTPSWSRFAGIAIVALGCVLSSMTVAQSKVWSDSITFKKAFSAHVPHSNYSESLKAYLQIFSEGKCLAAVEQLKGTNVPHEKTGVNSYNTGKELFDFFVDASPGIDKTAFTDDISLYKALQPHASRYRDALMIVECSYKLAEVHGINSSDLHHDLAALYVATAKDNSAAEQFKQALTLEPGNAHYWYDLAMLYYKSGNHIQADPYLQKLKVLMPGDSYVRNLADHNSSQIKSQNTSN